MSLPQWFYPVKPVVTSGLTSNTPQSLVAALLYLSDLDIASGSSVDPEEFY